MCYGSAFLPRKCELSVGEQHNVSDIFHRWRQGYALQMGQVNVYFVCSCALTAGSITLGIVSQYVFPATYSVSGQFGELRDDIRCMECQKWADTSSTACEKCHFSQRKYDKSCTLSADRKETLSQIINSQSGQENDLKETLELSHQKEKYAKSSLSYLAKNVPRPTAHWILRSNVSYGEEIVVSRWTHTTGSGYAHSKNGIQTKSGGEMTIPYSGWYLIYFQIAFAPILSNSTTRPSTGFQAVVQVMKEKSQDADLLKLKGTLKPRHHHPCFRSRHAVIRKERMFYLKENESLRLKVTVPKFSYITTRNRQSYFGVHFVFGA